MLLAGGHDVPVRNVRERGRPDLLGLRSNGKDRRLRSVDRVDGLVPDRVPYRLKRALRPARGHEPGWPLASASSSRKTPPSSRRPRNVQAGRDDILASILRLMAEMGRTAMVRLISAAAGRGDGATDTMLLRTRRFRSGSPPGRPCATNCNNREIRTANSLVRLPVKTQLERGRHAADE